MDGINQVKLNPRLRNSALNEQLIKAICEKLQQEFPALERMKNDIELIIYLANLIEELVFTNKLNKKKIPNYKLDLAIKIFERLGFSSEADKLFLTNTINTIHTLGHIKRIPLVKKIKAGVIQFLKNKLM